MKTCFKCGQKRPLTEFYAHPAMADGHLGKCKSCTKADVKLNYKVNRCHYVDYEKKRWPAKKAKDSARKQTAAYKEYKKKWRRENAEKQLAHNLVAKALRTGELVRQPCEVCNSFAVEGHHADYSKPLDVNWLCVEHHREEHSRIRGIAT